MSKPINGSSDWKTELNIAALKYHVLIAWVAVILNPIWAIADYYVIPDHFVDFLIFRIAASFIVLTAIFFKNKLKEKPEIFALLPFIFISVQNAYMYSVMDVPELQKHTFAYITLFIGAGMFVLWKPVYSIIVVAVTFIANIIFFSVFSTLLISDVLINGGLLTASVALFTILLINTRTNLTKREIIARLALAESNQQLAEKNKIIEEKSKDISDSINYAQRIQQAILPPLENLNKSLNEYFILYRPKDVVSGDFYWHANINIPSKDNEPAKNVIAIAAVDCTGHGVPGALMSIIGSTILNQTTNIASFHSPANALSFLNKEVTKSLNSIKDGMDIALCTIDMERLELQFAGANNSAYIIRNGKLIEIKADKQAIGADTENSEVKTFTNHIVKLEKNDCIYLFTDGYADQFGGPYGKKFKYKKFQELLISLKNKKTEEQKNILDSEHILWRGNLEQVDDILVIGIRI